MEYGRDHRDGGPNNFPPHERMIKIPGRRPVTDYNSSMIRWMRHRRPLDKGGMFLEAERPSASYIIDMVPPMARPTNAVDTIPCKYLHTSSNKEKHAINIVRWTPEGRRALTCSASGEFTLWNGTAFNFETLMQAHDHSIRAASYSHDGEWLVSGDMQGVIRYHNRDFNRVNDFQGHNDCVRDLAFSPNDSKFVSASDDATLKIFDFSAAQEDQSITGHSWEAKTVDWHPTKGLLVSGSKDHQVKLWDPRSGRCLTTLHGHKNTIVKTSFDPHRGQLLATCARDNVARIFDLRMMRDVCLLRGMNKEVTTLTWHPIHANLMTTGGHDGSILHYLLDEPHTPAGTAASIPPYDAPDPSSALAQTIWPAHRVDNAHSLAIWSLAWHPLGHILGSGGNDRCTRFWTRARPGESEEILKDAFHLGELAAEAQGTYSQVRARERAREQEERELQDEADGLIDQTMPGKAHAAAGASLPGLPGLGESGPPGLGGAGEIEASGMHQNRLAALQAQGILPPDLTAVPPPPPPGQAPGAIPPEILAMFQGGKGPPPGFVPPPPPGFGGFGAGAPPPPPPGFQLPFPGPNGGPPPPFPGGMPPALPGMPMPGMPGLPGMPMPGLPGLSTPEPGTNGAFHGEANSGFDAAGRRRTPLPSQQDGFKEEQRRGNYRVAK